MIVKQALHKDERLTTVTVPSSVKLQCHVWMYLNLQLAVRWAVESVTVYHGARLLLNFLFLFTVASTAFFFNAAHLPSLSLPGGHMALSALRCRSWQVSPSHDFRKSCIMHMKAVDGQDAFGTGNFFFFFHCSVWSSPIQLAESRPQLWIHFRQFHPVF